MSMFLLVFYQTILFSIVLIGEVLLENHDGSFVHLHPIIPFLGSYFLYALALLFLVYVYKQYHTVSFKKRIITSIMSFLLSFFLMFIVLAVLEKSL
ncbi:hypothetical protein GCM10010954_29660 [Halobacillus andaensis]|uniref:Uncharacterized protein n=1 Tax=Halobacillus andaensis TaxID=1176239 RepID=A0A917B6Y5_HALAA|nr:hypothetical protein [Halobacillus andaensis]MBP2005070.1 membrane protein YdbS with pleckstrin-like domain [Halobacillus andaensis]GGF28653.1 hypothetical protein GCM10010954_29660 [Halobacillus andaensis]